MSIPGSGYEFEPQEVSWQTRDILLFASSIGCKADELHFLYVHWTTFPCNEALAKCRLQELHPNFAVFPTYPVILPLKLTDQEVTDFHSRQNFTHIPGAPKLDFRNRLDGQRKITILKPLPKTSAGRRFYLRNKVIGVYDKGDSGTAIETEQSIVEEGSGAVYSKTTSSSFLVGQGNWGGPRGPRTFPDKPPEGVKPTAVCVVKTSMEAAYLYRLNGDYNPLHASPERGRQQGFPGTIIHGLFSWNSAAHSILRELGSSDPANLKEFQARFASPVYPGDTLITEIWRTGQKQDDFEDIRFTTKNDKGELVLSNGRCLLRTCSRKSAL